MKAENIDYGTDTFDAVVETKSGSTVGTVSGVNFNNAGNSIDGIEILYPGTGSFDFDFIGDGATSLSSTVTVNVEDSNGNPLTNADVSITDSGSTEVFSGATDGSGQVTTDLGDGDYTVEASKQNYPTQSKQITVAGSPISTTITLDGRQAVSGTVTTQTGAPVENATVVGYAAVMDTKSLEENRQELDSLANQIPNAWREEGAGKKLIGDNGAWTADGVTSYVATHRGDAVAEEAPWITDHADLRKPLIELPANEDFIVSAWDAQAGGYGDTTCLPLAHEYDCQLPGKHKSEATIVVERIGPGGDITLNNTITLDKQSGGGFGDGDSFRYATLSLSPGFYYIHEEGAPRGVPRKVGDTTSIIDAYEEDVRGDLSKRAQEVKDAIDNNRVERIVATTDENGQYTLNVPVNAKIVTIQSYHAPALQRLENVDPQNLTTQQIRTQYNAALTTSMEDRTQTQRELLNSSVYFPSVTKTVEPPADNVDIQLYELSAPPGANVTALQNQLQQLRNRLNNLTLSDLPPSLLNKLDDNNIEELRQVYTSLMGTVENYEPLKERYLEISERDTIADADELDKGELIAEINAANVAINSLDPTKFIEPPTKVIDDDNISLTWAVPDADLTTANVSVIADYSNGTSQVVSDEYIQIDDSMVGTDNIRLVDFPLGETDPAQVSFRLQVSGDDVWGKTRTIIKNPTYNGKVPTLDAISFSTLQPGPGDNVEMTLHAAEDSSFRKLTNVTVYGPDGAELTTGNITNGQTVNFTTAGAGIHRIAFTVEDLDGSKFSDTVRLKAGETDTAMPPTITGHEGPLGVYAIVGDGLESGRIDIEDDGSVTVVGQIGQSADVPSKLSLHLETLSTQPDSTKNVRLVRGDARESINSHVRVTVHTKALSEKAIIYWGDSKPVTTDGSTRYGDVDKRADGVTIQTYTDKSGELTLRTINAPGLFDRLRYTFRKNIADLDVPFVGTIVVPDIHGPPVPTVGVATVATSVSPTNTGLIVGV